MASWKPGTTVEYTRTVFMPRFPYVGELFIEVGLFAKGTGRRLPLEGKTRGQRSFEVARLNIELQEESYLPVFKDGWHATEQAEGSKRDWQWSTGWATLAFRNPMRNALLYVQMDRPGGFQDSQTVSLVIGGLEVDRFLLAPGEALLRKVSLDASILGEADVTELRITVDRTFVPAQLPGSTSSDRRELGVRVFRVFVEPRH